MGAFDCSDMDGHDRVGWGWSHFNTALAGVLGEPRYGVQRGRWERGG